MNEQQRRLILAILFLSISQIDSNISVQLNQIQQRKSYKFDQSSNYSSLLVNRRSVLTHCSKFVNDEDAVTFPEFTIPLDSPNTHSTSSGWTNENGHIFHLEIINEKFLLSTIFALQQLKRLEIRNTCFRPCNRSSIPSRIECLASSLTELSIADTKITHLPYEIGNLLLLKTLKLSNTGLMSLPSTIGRLSALTILYLPNNHLHSLPITIRQLRSLQQLTLSNNPALHSVEPINTLPSLMILDTRNCPIEFLPRDLPQLTTLYMSNNSLTYLTGIETLGTQTNRRKSFYFDRNPIRFISPRIRHIKNLVRLHLDDPNRKS